MEAGVFCSREDVPNLWYAYHMAKLVEKAWPNI
jgi:hypothetical protein